MRPLIWPFLFVILLTSNTAATAAGPPRTNFVVILVDDLGWSDVGCFGSTFSETPNIDRLAARGVRFTDAYAACPVCSPTRASLLTGKYPARLHLTDWLPGQGPRPSQKLRRPDFNRQLPLGEVTLAKALKPLGYASACIGKWHLGGAGFSPEKHGFDVSLAASERGSTPSHFSPYRLPGLKDGPQGEYLADRLTDEAEKFIEKNRDRPFFLYLSHYAVHIPIQAKEALVRKYRAKARPGRPGQNPVYAAMLESVDESVGRVVRKLEELKIGDRTVVVFMSDNGGLADAEGPHTPATLNTPLRAGKGFLYEGGIRVPLVVRWPAAGKQEAISGVPVSSVDLFPTLLEVAGGVADPKWRVDGASLVPLLNGTGDWKREAIYWHYPHYVVPGGKPAGAIRRGDYKLVESFEDGRLELFNLKEDISEKHDLAGTMPDKARELHQALKDWRQSVDAQMPTPNPDYDPKKAK